MRKLHVLMAVLFAAAFSACSNDSADQKDLGPEKSVTVKLLTTPISKAADKTSVPYGALTPVNDVTVFFLDDNDRTVSAKGTMTGAEITSGKTFTGVNPATTKVYIVANSNHGGSPLFPGLNSIGLNQTKSDIEALSASAGSQMGSTAMGIDNALLSGEAALVQVNATDYTVNVPITPAVCRFEVTSITGYGDITAFDLEGIYLNTYYPQFTIGGGSAGTYYGISTTATELTNNVASFMKDAGLNKSGSLTYTNTDPANVWAYMVPVYTTSPRIILRLDNLAVNSLPMSPSTQYITVKNFKDATTGEAVVLKRGEVYVVKDIRFTANDVTINPNQDDINVTVTVEVKGWKVFSVDPEI